MICLQCRQPKMIYEMTIYKICQDCELKNATVPHLFYKETVQ